MYIIQFFYKPPTKASLVLRLMLSAFALMCGIYICSICLKQMSLKKNIFFDHFERKKNKILTGDIFLWDLGGNLFV